MQKLRFKCILGKQESHSLSANEPVIRQTCGKRTDYCSRLLRLSRKLWRSCYMPLSTTVFSGSSSKHWAVFFNQLVQLLGDFVRQAASPENALTNMVVSAWWAWLTSQHTHQTSVSAGSSCGRRQCWGPHPWGPPGICRRVTFPCMDNEEVQVLISVCPTQQTATLLHV